MILVRSITSGATLVRRSHLGQILADLARTDDRIVCGTADLAYPNLPVRLLATHAGVSMGFFGASHHATEDISATWSIANLMVVSPSDGPSFAALLRSTVDHPGPIYFRLGRGREETIHAEGAAEVCSGTPVEVRSDGTRILAVATGAMVAPCAQAADAVAEKLGERVASVFDAKVLKPFRLHLNAYYRLDGSGIASVMGDWRSARRGWTRASAFRPTTTVSKRSARLDFGGISAWIAPGGEQSVPSCELSSQPALKERGATACDRVP